MVEAGGDGALTLRRLQPEDVEAYKRLRGHSFRFPPGDDTDAAFRRRLPSTVGAFDDAQRLLASATGHRLEAYVAGRPRPLLGVAAVQTAPAARRRGLARRLIQTLLEDARDVGVGWGMLYPFDPPFYTRLGWQALPTGVRLRLPISALGTPSRTDAQALEGAANPQLSALYARCAAHWNFTDARTQNPWDPWEDLRTDAAERVAAFDLGDAYGVVRLRTAAAVTTLEVLDALWCSSQGREALLRLLRSYHGQAEQVEMEVPRDDALAWSWGDWYATATNATRMLRVIDVRAALAGLPYPHDAPNLTLRVHDDGAAWNDGSWRLAAGDEGCTVTPATGVADVAVDVRALALVVGGASTPNGLRLAGVLEGDDRALSVLAALAGGRSAYHALNDRF